jgi:rfaE bifunctional protein nucleotidyltransferase chain/domain
MRMPETKILDRERLLASYGRPRTQRLVFTNGCFDILHRGHVEYLAYARSLGDALVVGVNSDDSVRRLKGPGRPITPEADRTFVLAALESVDLVTSFPQDTPRELIAALLPDVLVKGGDYTPEQIVGGAEVIAAGGRVVVAPLLAGRSTTALIQRTRSGGSVR